MSKKKNHNASPPFFEKIALFDFEKYYTSIIRIVSHLLMWLTLTLFLQFSLLYDSGLPLDNALAFSGRSLICNMTVFYLFFYVLMPHTILKNRIVPAILSLPFCVILWIILNHYCLVFIGKHFRVEGAYYKRGIQSNLQVSFWYVVSIKNIAAELTGVFYSISPYFFIKIVFDVLRFYSKSFQSEREAAQLKVEKLNLEKNFLKAQLNPHFLFNTLNNLYGLVLHADGEAAEMVRQLSNMMRYTLYESDSTRVPLARELEFLKNYVMLQKIRYKADKDIVFDMDDSHVNGQVIAPLLTFAFVENGFKYGLKSKNGGFLKINISVIDNVFYFLIVNDKKEESIPGEFGGIGHVNVRKRLELLYPDKHELIIEDPGGSFCVKMKINLE